MKELEEELLLYGLSAADKIIKPSKSIVEVAKIVRSKNDKEIILEKTSLKKIKNSSENFMKSHFNIHKINHTTSEEIENAFLNTEFENIEDILKTYKKVIKKIDPYHLPIILLEEDVRFSEIENLRINCDDNNLLVRLPIVFGNIFLSNSLCITLKQLLTHEITHSQINSSKKLLSLIIILKLYQCFYN